MQAGTEVTETGPGPLKPQGRFFYGWWIVAAASIFGMFGNGAISSGFPRFFEPIRQDLGISYSSMSLVFSLARAEGGMGGPLVGWLVDKFGARPMVLWGGLTAGVGLILLSRADTYWELVILFARRGLGGQDRRAGPNADGGGQSVVHPPESGGVINADDGLRRGRGLRGAAAGPGNLATGLAGHGALDGDFCNRDDAAGGLGDSEQAGGYGPAARRRPAGGAGLPPPAGADEAAALRSSRSRTFRCGRRCGRGPFWLLLAGVITRVSATNAVIIHIFPMLAMKGLDETTATLYVSAMFFLAIPLRFLLGVAGGRFAPRKLLFWGMNLGAVALFALWGLPGMWGVVVFVLGLAIVEGVTSVNWLMVGGLFRAGAVRQPDGGDERFPQRGAVRGANLRRLGAGPDGQLRAGPVDLRADVRRQRVLLCAGEPAGAAGTPDAGRGCGGGCGLMELGALAT